ncbi:MAG: ornithine cyclodeaminase family protein [Betaproteobacteria bacterium]|jgi:alanine dehydrogenase|nr:ornithine cyclodeaminase family protein [Betaproteobacteria bacterium]
MTTPTDRRLLYLSRADIDALALTPSEIETAVETAFRGLAGGRAESLPKQGIDPTPASFFHSMPARLDAAGTVGVKWVGVAANADDPATRHLPNINAMILLSDLRTAQLLAVMDGDAITALRPAAVSLVAARRLARAESRRMGFIACGVQARAHLQAFAAVFPIRELACYSRRLETAQSFAAEARALGFEAHAVSDPRAAVAGMDIIVSSVPRAKGLKKFLDPAWLAPGAFVSATDLARCWDGTRLRDLELLATDDRAQSREAAAQGHIPWQGEFDAALSELVTGSHPGRRHAAERAMFIHPGLGLGDIAVAAFALARARERGLGTLLPR